MVNLTTNTHKIISVALFDQFFNFDSSLFDRSAESWVIQKLKSYFHVDFVLGVDISGLLRA